MPTKKELLAIKKILESVKRKDLTTYEKRIHTWLLGKLTKELLQ